MKIVVRGDGTVKSAFYDAKNSTFADSRIRFSKIAALTATFWETSSKPRRSGYIDIQI